MDVVISQGTGGNVIKPVTEAAKVGANPMRVGGDKEEYRSLLKKMIDTTVRQSLDEEMRKATLEMQEEQRRAIKEILEEQRVMVRKLVEEEKKAIWTRVEETRRSILTASQV